ARAHGSTRDARLRRASSCAGKRRRRGAERSGGFRKLPTMDSCGLEGLEGLERLEGKSLPALPACPAYPAFSINVIGLSLARTTSRVIVTSRTFFWFGT